MAASRSTIVLIYLGGCAQGLALVTFPAASATFVGPTGFHLTSAQYGGMFVPQVAMAVLASALGPWLSSRFGLRGTLAIGLGGDLAAMALLAASPLLMGTDAAYVLLCVATAALGLGFGATVPTLNTLVEDFFPGREDGAVLALNALLGLGTALAPALVALCGALGAWWTLPLGMAILIAALISAFVARPGPLGESRPAASVREAFPPRFWLYFAAAGLYGVVETLNGNWATVYLSAERHVSAREASFALTAFWLMVTVGRVIFALLGRWLPAKWVYLALPFAIAAVFQWIGRIDGALSGIAAFGAAGLACSALLPLSVSLAGAEFPKRAAVMSGELIAVYQIGYGVAAFGVGPLNELGGFSYSAAFSLGSLVALALGGVAWLVARGPGRSGSRAPA